MEFNEEEYLKILISDGEESVSFFSNKRKSERERLICAAFLKCLGVDFSINEIDSLSYRQQPPDIIFRSARFEVREILDENRRRHDEFKKKLNNVRNAKNMKDIMKFESYSSNPITYSKIINN